MAQHQLYIDLETYSDVDISKAGLFKYAQSPAFAILLFAYSLDGGPVEVADLTEPGAFLPQTAVRWMFDPDCTKHAYNAPFEWYCLSRYFRLEGNRDWPPERWLSQWRCTMLHGLYCGYPAGLDAVGRALELPQDKRKLMAGKALIRYFCVPGPDGTRRLPSRDPEKWELFKTYNAQDVVTEMEIERKLSAFPVPDAIQQQWEIDQRINARGVAVDLDLVEGALAAGSAVRQALTEEARQISGLANPNSVGQLSAWLINETGEAIDGLRKDTVKELLGRGLGSPAAHRMLEIRQELGKTSVKKYDAMSACACADGRARGLLQFYGANRTGRWAGRLIQVQNLPRTHLPALPLARDLVKAHDTEALRIIYGSVPDTLSQLIRTALIAPDGKVLVDADFSAIEARVIAWLAGEEWVLEVFRTTGKIYEAAAAQMFGIPMERIAKGNPEYDYRQKGKVATLALGYQGSTGALINMGALAMGIPEEELPDIVQRWRQANPHIVRLWYDVERAAIQAVSSGRPCAVRCLTFAREVDPVYGLDFLTIALPSGRKLYYAQPHMGKNRFGRDSLCYFGTNQTSRKWEAAETYGGKIVENCVQAIARDCLAEAITRLEAAGHHVVFHVHDEAVIEADRGCLDEVAGLMAQPVPWAPGLPLDADGWTDRYYKKD